MMQRGWSGLPPGSFAHATFAAAGVEVLGISAASVQAHTRFTAKYGVSFPLLSDTTPGVATAYRAWGEKKVRGRTVIGMRHMTFLIDEEGTMQRIWSTVKPAGHAAEVLAALQHG